jgi:hypothetical protein
MLNHIMSECNLSFPGLSLAYECAPQPYQPANLGAQVIANMEVSREGSAIAN